jgi:hypothetical protein
MEWEDGGGVQEESWISSLVSRPDEVYSDVHELCSSWFGVVQCVSKVRVLWGGKFFEHLSVGNK